MVLYRTESGRARLSDPVSPHLGASLALGRVQGENLICGMHGFEFDGDGRCVKLAYGTRPPLTARLALFPVQEINGYIDTYYSPDGSPPTWKLEPLNWEGWTSLRHGRLEFVGHPQKTTENSVDIGHFQTVHYYTGTFRRWCKQFYSDGLQPHAVEMKQGLSRHEAGRQAPAAAPTLD